MIDLHVLAPPPQPHAHGVNNFVEAMYVHDLKYFAQNNNVSFFDFFEVMQPCLNEEVRTEPSPHHYFMNGDGIAGRVYFFGDFLGQICQ
jgi:hypothetical protein